MKTLLEIADSYVLLTAVCKRYKNNLRLAVRRFGEFLGRGATVDDLNADNVSRWVATMDNTRTSRNLRACLISLWYHAAALNLAAVPNVRLVRKVKVKAPQPEAWTLDEMRRLIQAASHLSGYLTEWNTQRKKTRRCRLCDYFPALMHVAYETGLRRGDIWALRRDQIDADGVLVLEIHKTGVPHVAKLTAPTLALIDRLPGVCPLAWNKTEKLYYDCWRMLCEATNVPMGATHRIRKTAATHLWLDRPEVVQRFLGHLTPSMQNHYIDRLRFLPDPVQPPAMEGGAS